MTLTYRERPAGGEPAGALVLLHGRGADEHDLFPLLDMLDPERRLAGYTPRAPLALPAEAGSAGGQAPGARPEDPAAFGGRGGAHWYVVPRVGYPDPETFASSYATAAEWLDELNFPPERIVLGGFSQGAVMSYALGLGEGRPRPAAIVAFSGFIPQVEGWRADLARPLPPIAIGHGTYDDIISVEFGRAARELLDGAPGDGKDVLYREYPLPHAIDPRFVEEVRDWLPRLLRDDA